MRRVGIIFAVAAAMTLGGSAAAVADAHISVRDAGTGPAAISIETSNRGGTPSVSMSVSNGDKRIDIDTGALGPESGADEAAEAIDGLETRSVRTSVRTRGEFGICTVRPDLDSCD